MYVCVCVCECVCLCVCVTLSIGLSIGVYVWERESERDEPGNVAREKTNTFLFLEAFRERLHVVIFCTFRLVKSRSIIIL